MQWEIIIAKLFADKYRVLYLSRSLCYCCQIVNTLFLRVLYLSLTLALAMTPSVDVFVCLRASMCACDTLWICWAYLYDFVWILCTCKWIGLGEQKTTRKPFWYVCRRRSNSFKQCVHNNRTEHNVCQNHHTHTHGDTNWLLK